MIYIYVVGPAGSGKSTFTSGLQQWMRNNQYEAITVNLDPGVENIPYTPDVDVREWYQLQDIMEEYSLGPNGAQILASDLIASDIDEIREEIVSYDADYAIVDTPGQLELFAFRTSSDMIVKGLSEKESYMAFIMDPMLALSPSGYVSLLTLSASVFFRFYIPYINIINKIDLLNEEDILKIRSWIEDVDDLYNDLRNEREGMVKEYAMQMFRSMESLGINFKPIFVSSRDMRGMEDVYSNVQLVYFGGEDLEKR
ncbi:MAG: ATP/GTP-binding protein [Thermoplasmata archaeon]|jgi:GTPase SAR1 family protein|nr:GTPase [Thermoplasmatales archaeon]PMP73993.1 MAG: GTPase [Aciduliprofundum sp.]HEU13019.1 GTPase [Euryarchaeota archaeon]